MNECDVVMLYSGGADSYLMLHLALMANKKPYAVLIDYGQKHISELKYAESQLTKNNVPYKIVKISNLGIDSGLTGYLNEARWSNVHPMNVPARNTIMLGIAMSIAEHMDIHEVWYGADFSDRENLFPDCYQEYVVKINELAKVGLATDIKVYAPLLGLTKEMILSILENSFKVNLTDMFSGYENTDLGEGC